jgi:hypothetical protein
MADPYQLVVEGKDDQHVLYALLAHHDFKPEFAIQDEGGIESLFERMPIRLRARDLQRLGVVVDADFGAAARWDRLKDVLAREGYIGLPRISQTPTVRSSSRTDCPASGFGSCPTTSCPACWRTT